MKLRNIGGITRYVNILPAKSGPVAAEYTKSIFVKYKLAICIMRYAHGYYLLFLFL